jgi:hypothetical protein
MAMNAGPSPSPVPICASCGVVAREGATCESCGEAIVRVASPARGPVIWSAVRASFACRSCGFPSPLEGVVVADGIECAQCGSYQRFDKSDWSSVLTGSHDVADLGGPDPEGRFPSARYWIGDVNPYATLGVTETFAKKVQSGEVTIENSPGFPVCKACKRPFDIRFENGITVVHCSQCQASASYAMPREMSAFAPKAVAVIAEEQRHGRVEARVHQGDAGVVTMTCPQCGAALKGDGQSSTAVCTYCHALAFIPSRARPKGAARLAKPIVFFVAFEGPSPARADLEQPNVPDPGKRKLPGGGFFSRELEPLYGVDLAPLKPGTDVKQWMLTIGLTTLALVFGYVIISLFF